VLCRDNMLDGFPKAAVRIKNRQDSACSNARKIVALGVVLGNSWLPAGGTREPRHVRVLRSLVARAQTNLAGPEAAIHAAHVVRS
jgi:hypothetical protein